MQSHIVQLIPYGLAFLLLFLCLPLGMMLRQIYLAKEYILLLLGTAIFSCYLVGGSLVLLILLAR